MENLIRILEDIQPDVDYETLSTLVDDHILDSLSILALVADLEDEFDILIPTVEIIPDNFNSASQIWALIQRLKEEG